MRKQIHLFVNTRGCYLPFPGIWNVQIKVVNVLIRKVFSTCSITLKISLSAFKNQYQPITHKHRSTLTCIYLQINNVVITICITTKADGEVQSDTKLQLYPQAPKKTALWSCVKAFQWCFLCYISRGYTPYCASLQEWSWRERKVEGKKNILNWTSNNRRYFDWSGENTEKESLIWKHNKLDLAGMKGGVDGRGERRGGGRWGWVVAASEVRLHCWGYNHTA